MSRSLKEIAKTVREDLKKEIPDCKFSVRTEYYSMGSALHVSLMRCPFKVYFEKPTYWSRGGEFQLNYGQINGNLSLPYGQTEDRGFKIRPHAITREAYEVLGKAKEIANRENWDDSDVMTDYYSVNYAFHLYVGRHDKECVET